MRRPLVAWLVALVLPLGACSDGTEPEPNPVVGTYTLRSVNGGALPFTLSDNGLTKVEVMSGTITLHEDLRYAEERTYRNTADGVANVDPQQYSGTYSRVGTDLTINSDGQLYVLMLNGGAITERVNGYTIVWTK